MKTGGGAAEMLVMHSQRYNALRFDTLTPAGSLWDRRPAIGLLAIASLAILVSMPIASAQVRTAGFEPDYEASGFVAPAGMPSPDAYYSSVQQAGFFGGGESSCDGSCGQSGCTGGCGSSYGDGGYGGGGYGDGGYGGGGYGESCGGCGTEGCQSCDGLVNSRFACLFCRGDGCTVCQSIGRGCRPGAALGALAALKPYGEAGLCAQRWFDFSADVMFLGRNSQAGDQVLTTRNRFDNNPVSVLRAGDADDNGLKAGARLTGAFIFGAGGNLEVTYLGGQRWGDSASAQTNSLTPRVNGAPPNQVASQDGDLYSFLSGFGQTPLGGRDDTDRSISQSVNTFSTFHSAEVNYRRRTVEQFCRFQGSWLVGLRYLRFDDDFGYSTRGANDNTSSSSLPRYFNYRNELDNKMFGPQSGFDLWWNVIAGVNVGVGMKGAWLDNNIDRISLIDSNSLGAGATPGFRRFDDGRRRSTFMTELEATMLYRISHSWTLKSQYYLLSVDEVAFGYDLGPVRAIYDNASAQNTRIQTDDLVIQGFTLGAEYVW